jgi:hypothetical protein
MVAVVLAAVGSGISFGAARSPEEPAERLVMRLPDLPRGYYPLDFSEGAELELICEELDPGDPGPRLERFVRRFSPEGCLGFYLRAYRIPNSGPSSPIVGTGALDAGSDAAAAAGFALSGALLAKLTEEPLEEVSPVETIGEGTRLFHWRHAPRVLRNGPLGSFLVWRSGNVLAAIFASAGSLEVSDRIATDLARRQQTHIADPTPYTNSERFAFDVLLDDPALTIPVHWLGRSFRPGRGLPQIRLQSGRATSPGYSLPGQKLELTYSRNVFLNSWTARGWKRFLKTPRSRIMRTWRCTESTRIEIPGGHATVFAAHGRDYRVCPDRPPRLFFAFAYLDGTVTAVNFVSCDRCGQVPYGPYNSLRGMKAVVRGLDLRPEPDYATQSASGVAMRRLARTR